MVVRATGEKDVTHLSRDAKEKVIKYFFGKKKGSLPAIRELTKFVDESRMSLCDEETFRANRPRETRYGIERLAKPSQGARLHTYFDSHIAHTIKCAQQPPGESFALQKPPSKIVCASYYQ